MFLFYQKDKFRYELFFIDNLIFILEEIRIMKKPIIYIVILYFLALRTNFFESIKYPDTNISLLNLITSSLLLISVFFNFKWLKQKNFFKIFLLGGFLSGIISYITFEFIILGFIRDFSIILYILFITPFFGLNLLLGVNYGIFSVIISLFYLITLIYSLYLSKRNN